MKLHDDLEDCEDIELDKYNAQTTTVARARLCGKCVNYTIENRLMPSIRCQLGIRPQVIFGTDQKKFIPSCSEFKKGII
jgi:hypothetical protein